MNKLKLWPFLVGAFAVLCVIPFVPEGWPRFTCAGGALLVLVVGYAITRKGESINDKIRPR